MNRLGAQDRYPLIYRTHELVLHPVNALPYIAWWALATYKIFNNPDWICITGQKPRDSFNDKIEDFTAEEDRNSLVVLIAVLLHNTDAKIVVMDGEIDSWLPLWMKTEQRLHRHVSKVKL